MDGVTTVEISSDSDGSVSAAPLVVGPENALLLPSLERFLRPQRVTEGAEDCGATFSPLVLVGTSGSGKSTLLRAIVGRWTARYGRDQVRYFNIVDFGREVQSTHGQRNQTTWREELQQARLLVVDDLQRARHRSTVQIALRTAMDAITERGGLAVFASQVLPASLLQLDVGLRDRLSAGLTVQIHWPAKATRREIIRNAAQRRSVVMSKESVEQLAANLEGSAARIVGAVTELDCCPDACLNSDVELTTSQIAVVVGRYLGVSKADLIGKSRRRSIVFARSVTAHLARRLTKSSYSQIGQTLGKRDHTTMMHADRSVAIQAASDPATQHALEELERIIRSP